MNDDTLNQKDYSRNFPKWLTLFRVMLGIILLVKGISFFHNSTALESMMHRKGWNMFDTNAQTLSFIITYANLLGGLFIATGLFTRWASIVQIPILIGAIIFNIEAGISFSNKELVLSALALLLLLIFVIKGSGALSADEFSEVIRQQGRSGGIQKSFFNRTAYWFVNIMLAASLFFKFPKCQRIPDGSCICCFFIIEIPGINNSPVFHFCSKTFVAG